MRKKIVSGQTCEAAITGNTFFPERGEKKYNGREMKMPRNRCKQYVPARVQLSDVFRRDSWRIFLVRNKSR
ncbi:MAG: hypothetical protein D3906_04200 [Candidatus Electrothrix sp. AUS1_2]|nr:hypothetical protein [Candidatus Electrothrix sp. AUS1_2]